MKVLTDFLELCERVATAQDQDAADWLRTLVAYISADVYEITEDCITYNEAISCLKKAYIKLPNALFTRHISASRKQKPDESLQMFVQALFTLDKDCTAASGVYLLRNTETSWFATFS